MDATGLTPLMAAVAAGRMIQTPVFSDKAHYENIHNVNESMFTSHVKRSPSIF
jgi:hypothetical protein